MNINLLRKLLVKKFCFYFNFFINFVKFGQIVVTLEITDLKKLVAKSRYTHKITESIGT